MQLLTGLQFNICYVIKTKVGFEIAEVARFLNYISSYSWNTLYFSLYIQFSCILVLRALNTLSPVFSSINNNNLFLFYLKDMEKMLQYFCCLFFTALKKKIFISKYFQHWFNTFPSHSTLISHEVFGDYQINLENTTNLNSRL